MSNNATQNSLVNNLIQVAQTTVREDIRTQAIRDLWDICGQRLSGVMAGKSYQVDSDFSLNGYSPKERQEHLMGNAFEVFHSAIMSFDTTLGVPFMAYITQKGYWHLDDEKRRNSKRSAHEICIDFTGESGSYDNEDSDEARSWSILKSMPYEKDIEEECFRKDAIQVIRKIASSYPRMTEYLDACMDVCEAGLNCTDAEVARNMGCTRACVGQIKKKLQNLLLESMGSYPFAA